jgi:hypothetical protein
MDVWQAPRRHVQKPIEPRRYARTWPIGRHHHDYGAATPSSPVENSKSEIEIGGASGGIAHDVVNVANFAYLSGQLQLALLNGFAPGASDTLTILTAANGIFGAFSNVADGARLDTIDDLGSFQVNYGAGSAFNPNQVVLNNFIPTTRRSSCRGRVLGQIGRIAISRRQCGWPKLLCHQLARVVFQRNTPAIDPLRIWGTYTKPGC